MITVKKIKIRKNRFFWRFPSFEIRFFSEQLVFIQGGAATPLELVRAMTEHGVCNNVRGVRLLHMALEGDAYFANPEFESTNEVVKKKFRHSSNENLKKSSETKNCVFFSEHFRSVNLYIGWNMREAVNDGRADFIPIFNHETPKLFYERRVIPDVALIHVSSPDSRGFCSLGTSVDCTRAAICNSKCIIGQFCNFSTYFNEIVQLIQCFACFINNSRRNMFEDRKKILFSH